MVSVSGMVDVAGMPERRTNPVPFLGPQAAWRAGFVASQCVAEETSSGPFSNERLLSGARHHFFHVDRSRSIPDRIAASSSPRSSTDPAPSAGGAGQANG